MVITRALLCKTLLNLVFNKLNCFYLLMFVIHKKKLILQRQF